MKITFKYKNEQHVQIYADDVLVGHVFTPASSGERVLNAIQVCGFDEAYDLWGCGVFSDEQGMAKKDIQLMFSKYKATGKRPFGGLASDNCIRCYNDPCNCETKHKDGELTNPFTVKRAEVLEKKLETADKKPEKPVITCSECGLVAPSKDWDSTIDAGWCSLQGRVGKEDFRVIWCPGCYSPENLAALIKNAQLFDHLKFKG